MVLRKILIGVVAVVLFLTVRHWEVISYGMSQGVGQLKVVWESRPIEEFLTDPQFPDSLKSKVKLIQDIKAFSANHLGIKEVNAYSRMYNQKGKTILWNLTACEPFAFVEKRWRFPIIGSFPYKGFFDLEKAKAERNELKQAGYDTRIRPVNGWSTLGWFNDPILSNMLYRSEGSLAELIIHELTHGVLYIRDSVAYNENLATFIGKQGAQQFLISKYGPGSVELQQYIESTYDRKRYTDHFILGFMKLDSLYGTMHASLDNKDKLKLKNKMIREIVHNIDTISFKRAGNYRKRFAKELPNNAYFKSLVRYHATQGDFDKTFQEDFNGDIKLYLDYLIKKFPSL